MKFATKVLSYKASKDDSHGALRTPIYANAAFEYESAEALEAVFCGQKAGHVYSRASNPTVEEFELKIQNAVDAVGVVALSSGMAAITNAMLAILQSGDNIVTTNKLFGHTISFFQSLLSDFGVEVRYVDLCNSAEIDQAIDAKTKLFFCESISNPGLIIPDFEAISTLCKKHNIPFMLDSTMTPWPIFDAKANGVDVELISATKFISGGGTSLGGIIVDHGSHDWSHCKGLESFSQKFKEKAFLMKLKKQTARNLGGSLSPFNAYLLSLGMETLELRVKKACKNSLKIAQFLDGVGCIQKVNYPFLKGNAYKDVAKKQFTMGGSLVVFDFEDKARAYKFMNGLSLIKKCTNIQDNKSLIIAPYNTIYAEYSDELKSEFGLHEGSVRLSVGIESAKDLIDEIKLALKGIE